MEPDVIQTSTLNNAEGDFSRNIIHVRITDQIKELQTVLRDRFVEAFVYLKMFLCGSGHCQQPRRGWARESVTDIS